MQNLEQRLSKQIYLSLKLERDRTKEKAAEEHKTIEDAWRQQGTATLEAAAAAAVDFAVIFALKNHLHKFSIVTYTLSPFLHLHFFRFILSLSIYIYLYEDLCHFQECLF